MMRNIGMVRWLSENDLLVSQTGEATSESQFIANGWQSYPGVVTAVNAGKQTFERDCGSCHTDGLGAHTNQKMVRLDEVGRFFAPQHSKSRCSLLGQPFCVTYIGHSTVGYSVMVM